MTKPGCAALALVLSAGCRERRAPPTPVPPAEARASGGSATQPTAAPVQRAAPSNLLLAVSASDRGTVFLTPIATWTDSVFVRPPADELAPEEADSAEFARDYFQQGRRYDLFSAGRYVGRAEVDSVSLIGCAGLGALAHAAGSGTMPVGARLATNAGADWTSPLTRRPLTPEDRSALYTTALDSLEQRGIPQSLRGSADSLEGAVFSVPNNPTVVRVATLRLSKPDDPAERVVSVFLVEETTGATHHVAIGRVLDGLRDTGADALVDAMDMDHDGSPELVIETEYSESRDYRIYARRRGRWIVVYTGGGGGC